jgi:hypothetical protein
MTAPSKQLDQFVVRLPGGLREHIKAAADANGRSMNAEIVHVLDRHFRPLRHFDVGAPYPADHDPDTDEPPEALPPEVRAALTKLVEQITNDAQRRLNDWLGAKG